MKFIRFIFVVLLAAGFVYAVDHPAELTGKPLPALGQLFNPFSGFWRQAEPVVSLPGDQAFALPGLSAPVKVVYDDRLVPHIFAENLRDAFAVQGYVTAYHRLFQMDLSTRAAAGRLSEVLGERTLAADREQRRMGIPWAAENAVEGWKQFPEFDLVEAYAMGINAYIDQLQPKDYPLEFKLLGYAPEKWTPLHTALFFKRMAQTLCFGNDDIQATNTRKLLGDADFAALFPEYNPKQSPIIPAGTPFNFSAGRDTGATAAAIDTALSGLFLTNPVQYKPHPFVGSNNWAVAGTKTKNGHPILCNDPHLNLTLPSIWFEVQIHTPEYNAYGVSLPGIPGIVIGFNENIAWGETNVGQDLLDWYRIRWTDDSRSAYLLDGKPVPVTYRYETIQVKGRENPVLDTVRYTSWGPVVLPDTAQSPYKDMAMRWLAHDKATDFDLNTFLKLGAAKNYEDYVAALKHYQTPPQNFVFASRQGDIGLWVNGKFPVKEKEQGRFVQDGSVSANAWKGTIPHAQVPHVKNPRRGFVSSANQSSTDPAYPYYYNGGFDDYRGRYLNRRLAEMDSITIDDMMRLQNDPYSIKAEEALPLMLALLDTTNLSVEAKPLYTALKGWDYRFEADEMAPALFDRWWRAFYLATWDEMRSQPDPDAFYAPEVWRTIALLEKEPQSRFFDQKATEQVEDAAAILNTTFDALVKDAVAEALTGGTLTWLKQNKPLIQHLARLDAFSESPNVNGYGDALNAVRGSHGPSWRMIVELGDTIRAFGVYPGGQSGNPGSAYYKNMVDAWSKGEYFPLFFMKTPDAYREKHIFSWQFN